MIEGLGQSDHKLLVLWPFYRLEQTHQSLVMREPANQRDALTECAGLAGEGGSGMALDKHMVARGGIEPPTSAL